jgi:hypothetical protein
MGLEFKTATLRFQRVESSNTNTQTVSFDSEVRRATTVLQGFSFDFEGIVEHPIDKVQVNVGTAGPPAGNDVEVQATVNYADKAQNEYNATVNILVIALTERDDDR